MNQESHEFLKQFLAVHNRLQAYVLSLVKDPTNADEIFQQTCLVLWERWSEFDSSRDFLPWAFGVARIEVKRFYARRENTCISLSDAAALKIAQSIQRSGTALEDRLAALQTCLERLPSRHRTLISECCGGEKTRRQMAIEWGMSPDALYQRLKRLRELLHECVDRVLVASELS